MSFQGFWDFSIKIQPDVQIIWENRYSHSRWEKVAEE